LTLDSASEEIVLQGAINFDRRADIVVHTASAGTGPDHAMHAAFSASRALRISGSLEEPVITFEKSSAR
jgi:hypothetical protein